MFAQDYLAKNPQMQYFEPRNGYLTCEITPEGWTADFKFVADVIRPGLSPPIDTGARSVDQPRLAGRRTPGLSWLVRRYRH